MRRKGLLYLSIVLGLLFLAGAGLAALMVPRMLRERRLARVRADWSVLWRACQICGNDCGGTIPSDTSLRRKGDPSIPQTFESDMQFMGKPTDRNFFILLTTPIAFQSLKAIPRDPFRSDGGYYGYAAINRPGLGSPVAFLHSPGPDGRTDLEPAVLREQIVKLLPDNNSWVLTPQNRIAIRKLIDPMLYDPTNGAASGGDLILIMECQALHYGFAWEADTKEWGEALNGILSAGKAGK